jgi:hypothetical protein
MAVEEDRLTFTATAWLAIALPQLRIRMFRYV